MRPHRWQPIKAPPSLGFSRQEHWSGLPFPSPIRLSLDIAKCPQGTKLPLLVENYSPGDLCPWRKAWGGARLVEKGIFSPSWVQTERQRSVSVSPPYRKHYLGGRLPSSEQSGFGLIPLSPITRLIVLMSSWPLLFPFIPALPRS